MKGLVTVILDGWGLREEAAGNAIKAAQTPNFDSFWTTYPHLALAASGLAVGLPEGQMGTSEVNHAIIGAGRIIYQDLVRINQAIADKTFGKNPAFQAAFQRAKQSGKNLHIKGLLSPGGVHSHQDHIYALVEAAKDVGVERIFLHVFTDGRDTAPKSSLIYVKSLQIFLDRLMVGKISTICGRYFAMDRDHNDDRTEKAYRLLTEGKGEVFDTAEKAVATSYEKGITDEFIEPSLVKTDKEEPGLIKSRDAVIFANFRTDRPRQLVEKFLEKGPSDLEYVTMTEYSPDYKVKVAFPPVVVKNCLGEVLSHAGLKQLRVTETEKYAHLTFFMNCKKETPYEGEDRILLDSYSDIKTHDQRPEMRAADISREVIQDIRAGSHQAIFANLCNADMVGHTGNLAAAIKGVETIDHCLGEIVAEAKKHDFGVMILGDHGNAEEMVDPESRQMLTSHTLNDVPLILITSSVRSFNRDQAGLQDVAPTILTLLGQESPPEMTGKSLV